MTTFSLTFGALSNETLWLLLLAANFFAILISYRFFRKIGVYIWIPIATILANIQVLKPSSYTWPTFLTRGNLLSIGNQVAVTAIIAIAMTMVIITAGIDLSVGSLMALSGVLAAWTIHRIAGDGDPGVVTVALACFTAVLLSGAIGLL